MNAKILTKEPQVDPLWYRVLDRFGPATFGWLAVLSFGYLQGGAYVRSVIDTQQREQQQTAEFIQFQIETSRLQRSAIDRLVDADQADRQFQELVLEVHQEQLDVLTDTNERMQTAETAMSEVPEQRGEMIVLLKQISDSLAKNGHE